MRLGTDQWEVSRSDVNNSWVVRFLLLFSSEWNADVSRSYAGRRGQSHLSTPLCSWEQQFKRALVSKALEAPVQS